MKLNSDLLLAGNQIKEVGFPTDHNDAISRAFIESKIACWTGTRYYCVSSLGNDAFTGYSDINPKLALLNSVRSIERLQGIIPRIGSGASISISIESGTYTNFKLSLMDYDSIDIQSSNSGNIIGKYYCLEVNDSCDMIRLGNENGSNADLSQINFSQSRLRFGPETITCSLRNFSSDFYFHTGLSLYSRIHSQQLLTARPCAEDYLYIEEPSVKFNSFELNTWTFNQTHIEGISATDKFICNSPLNKPDISFCYGPGIIKT